MLLYFAIDLIFWIYQPQLVKQKLVNNNFTLNSPKELFSGFDWQTDNGAFAATSFDWSNLYNTTSMNDTIFIKIYAVRGDKQVLYVRYS